MDGFVNELEVDPLSDAGFLLSINLARCLLVCLNLSNEFLSDIEMLPVTDCGIKNSLISRSKFSTDTISLSVAPDTDADDDARSELLPDVLPTLITSSKLKTFSKMSTLLDVLSDFESPDVSVDWVVVDEVPLLKRPFFFRWLLDDLGRRPLKQIHLLIYP